MHRIFSALLLALTLSAEQTASAFSSDAASAMALDNCDGLPTTNNPPKFSVCLVKGSYDEEGWEPANAPYNEAGTYAALSTSHKTVLITDYAAGVDDEGVSWSDPSGRIPTDMANALNYACGGYFYSGPLEGLSWGQELAFEFAGFLTDYLNGIDDEGITVTEQHDGSSFSVSCDIDFPGYHRHCEVSKELDGAVVPTCSLRHGRDNDPCQKKGCAACAPPGMPVWDISEPYLNLWVYDTPVFYKTSLGEEIDFRVDYKQRDTRPKNDDIYPTTGWNHNWYSYVHFDIPVMGSVDPTKTNTAVIGVSARGVYIRANWILTNDYSQWQAILYAPDNSESYYSADGSTQDLQNQRGLIPIFATNGITGFRLVHGDGSQDIYGLVVQGQHTYGVVERYGCMFDKGGMTNGMDGVWRLNIAGADSPHQVWQDGDDAANYTSDSVASYASVIGQLGCSDDPGLVEYVAYDAMLTARLDPYGNKISLAYADGRLSTITDYDSKTTSIGYDTNGYLQTVTMPYGRVASFVHDPNGNLLSVTDAQGMTSSMTYVSADGDLNYRLASLTTPYGTTGFSYQDDGAYVVVHRPSYIQYDSASGSSSVVGDPNTVSVYEGENAVNHAIIVTHPDNSKELYGSFGSTNNLRLPATLPLNAAGGPVDNGAAGGDASLLWRNCFHWSRAQTPLLSAPVEAGVALTNLIEHDFLVGTWQHFPVEISDTGSANTDIAPFPTFIREGSPDGSTPGNLRWFTYDNQWEPWQMEGEPLDWAETTMAPDGTALPTTYSHDGSYGMLTGMSQPYSQPDGSIYARTYTWQYDRVAVEEDDGTVWYFPVLTGIYNPFVYELSTDTMPELTEVNGCPALSWPVIPVHDGEGDTTTFFYNARHQLTGIQHANGLTETNLYGGDGFLQKSVALQSGATNSYLFQNGEVAVQTTPLGLTVGLTHDLLGRLTSAGFPNGTTISNVFDKLDVVAHKDRLGHWSYATFDDMGQKRTVTGVNGGVTHLSYCLCGGLYSVTDPQNNTTTFLRDYLGRVTNVLSAAGSKVIERDNLGRPFHISSTWGLDLRLGHNYQGLVTTVTNPAGTVFLVEFDQYDLPVAVTDDRGVTETRTFDTLRRLTGRYNDTFGWVEQWGYTAQGLSSHTDALGRAATYGYDPAGRLSAVTNPNQEVTQVSYDVPHRRVSLTDGRNNTKWWGFDLYGRQIAETNANGVLVRTNAYDANSRLTVVWTAAKGLAAFDLDNDGNVLAAHYPHGTIGGTYDLLDRRLTMSDGVGSHTFTYANFGAFDWAPATEAGPLGTISHGYSGPNLASVSIGSWVESITRDAALRPQTITSPAGTFTYGFNGAGRQLASLEIPGSTTTFGYDAVGDPNLIQVQRSGQTVDYHGYDYNGNGWITAARRRASPNTVSYSYGYDNIGQLTSVQSLEPDGSTPRLNETLGYSYDASDNLATRTTANTLIQTFTSDALDQLASITREGTLTVSGSFTGAVATLGVNGTPAQIYSDSTFATTQGLALSNANNLFVTAGSNAAGQLVLSTITSTLLPVTVSLSYDLNGNLIGDGQRVFEYGDENQLTAVTVSNAWRTEFVYDGLGRRRIVRDYAWSSAIGNWALTNQTRYVCDGYLPVQERDGSGNVLVTYTRGLDMSGSFGGAGGIGGLLARTDSNGSTFYHADVGGNITSLTDFSGHVVARYLYDPFGRLLARSGPMADANAMRFSSMPYYPNAGIVGYAFRVYDPVLQRWLNQDPIREAGGINLYGLVGNNPIGRVDPYGLYNPITGPGGAAGPASGLADPALFIDPALLRPVYYRPTGPPPHAEMYWDSKSGEWVTAAGINTDDDPFLLALPFFKSPFKLPCKVAAETTAAADVANLATQPNRIYSARVLIRAGEESGPFHNFPESFNQQIFDQGTRTVTPNYYNFAKPGLSSDSVMYQLPGNVNGVSGTFEIGVRPSVSGNTEVIMHRFFNPNP